MGGGGQNCLGQATVRGMKCGEDGLLYKTFVTLELSMLGSAGKVSYGKHLLAWALNRGHFSIVSGVR